MIKKICDICGKEIKALVYYEAKFSMREITEFHFCKNCFKEKILK